jgi:hypothetical protein
MLYLYVKLHPHTLSIKMSCDYYVDSCLVIEYKSHTGTFCKLTTDLLRKRKYIRDKPDYENDSTCDSKRISSYLRKLEHKLEKYTYKHMIYTNDEWVNDGYRSKYMYRIRREFPYVYDLKKMYIAFTAFKCEDQY